MPGWGRRSPRARMWCRDRRARLPVRGVRSRRRWCRDRRARLPVRGVRSRRRWCRDRRARLPVRGVRSRRRWCRDRRARLPVRGFVPVVGGVGIVALICRFGGFVRVVGGVGIVVPVRLVEGFVRVVGGRLCRDVLLGDAVESLNRRDDPVLRWTRIRIALVGRRRGVRGGPVVVCSDGRFLLPRAVGLRRRRGHRGSGRAGAGDQSLDVVDLLGAVQRGGEFGGGAVQ